MIDHFFEKGESRWADKHADLMSWRNLKKYLAGPWCGWYFGGHVHGEGVGAGGAELAATFGGDPGVDALDIFAVHSEACARMFPIYTDTWDVSLCRTRPMKECVQWSVSLCCRWLYSARAQYCCCTCSRWGNLGVDKPDVVVPAAVLIVIVGSAVADDATMDEKNSCKYRLYRYCWVRL